jgi:hypothetical protein
MDFIITQMVHVKYVILLVVNAPEKVTQIVILALIKLICMTVSAVQLAPLNSIRILKPINVMVVIQDVMNVTDQPTKTVNLVQKAFI